MLDVGAVAVDQDRDLVGAGIDDPVLGNPSAGIVVALFHDVAFRLIGADDLQHQVRAGPEPIAAPGVPGVPHQQQIRFAECSIGYAQPQRSEQHLAAASMYERREQLIEKGQDALMFVGRHRKEFKIAISQLDQLAAVVAQP